MIVENEPAVARILCERVEMHPGFTPVASLKSSYEATSRLAETKVDVVFANPSPRTQGLQFLQFLHLHWPEVGVVLVSDYPSFSLAQTAIQYRVFDYLLKPVSTAEVDGVLDRLLHVGLPPHAR